MHEAANVYPVLRPVARDGTIELDAQDNDARFGLTPLGQAVLTGYLSRPRRPRRRPARRPKRTDLD
jgi:hypothetical protein